MTRHVRSGSLMLIVIGLLGMALYSVVTRMAHPAFLDSDAAHGTWIGVCVGLELMGLARLRVRRATRAA